MSDLVRRPTSAEFGERARCLFPDTLGYRLGPPKVTIGDSETAVRANKHLVGDDVTISDTVVTDQSDPSDPPTDLGTWSVLYQHRSGDAQGANIVGPVSRGDIVAVLRPVRPPGTVPIDETRRAASGEHPVLGGVRAADWEIRLDFTGVTIAASAWRPAQYSATTASWVTHGFGPSDEFWVRLRPDWAPRLYYSVRNNHSDLLAPLRTLPWVMFFLVLIYATRTSDGCFSLRGTYHALVLRGIGGLSLLACVTAMTADAFYAHGSTTPEAPYAQLEVVVVILLIGWTMLLTFPPPRRGTFVVYILLTALAATMYFAPTVRAAFDPDPDYNDWLGVTGNLARMLAGAMLLAILITSVVFISVDALRAGIPALRRGSTAAPGLRRPVLVGAFLSSAFVSQYIRYYVTEWDHRRLTPGASSPWQRTSDVVGSSLAWLPDLIVHWMPVLLFFGALAAVVAALSRLGTAGGGATSPFIPPGSSAERLIRLLFAATAVGVYGSFRAVQIPVAFLACYFLLMPLATTDREGVREQLAEVRRRLPRGTGLGELQRQLLLDNKLQLARKRRDEALERRFERAEAGPSSGVIRAIERWWWSHSRPNDPNPSAPTKYSGYELALALGPRQHWFSNATYAASTGLAIAIPLIAYDLYQAAKRSLPYLNNSPSSVLDMTQSLLPELLLWTGLGFTLGALWPVLRGRRGIYKGLALGCVVSAALLIEGGLLRLVDQVLPYSEPIQVILIPGYLAVLGTVLDVSTSRNIERERWEFMDYLRLRDTRWVATYGAAMVLLAITIIRQVSGGQPLTSLPPSVIAEVVKPLITSTRSY